MKKLFLFVTMSVMAMSLNSCSSDDSSSVEAGGTVTLTVNGVAKTFDNVIVDKDTFDEGGETWTQLSVTASIGTSTSEVITFSLEQGDLGANAIWSMNYVKDGVNYYGSSLTAIVQTNNSNTLKGTFSGTFEGGADPLTVTNGSFNITH